MKSEGHPLLVELRLAQRVSRSEPTRAAVADVSGPADMSGSRADDNSAEHDKDLRAGLIETGHLLTVAEAAKLLRVGRNCLYEAIGRGEVPHRRIGRKILLSRRVLMRWLDGWSLQVAKEG